MLPRMKQPPSLGGDPGLGPEQTEALHRFTELVRRWNQVAGLVSSGDLERFWERHVLDSLLVVEALRWLHQEGSTGGLRLLDLGSGAGLPGVPIAVALPEVAVTLLERSAKKARFLNRVRDALGLRNARVLCIDLKAAHADLPGPGYDAAAARALMAPPSLWRSASRLLRPGGHLLALDRVERSPQVPKEELDLPEDYPGSIVLARRWARMPRLQAWHRLLIIRKAGPASKL